MQNKRKRSEKKLVLRKLQLEDEKTFRNAVKDFRRTNPEMTFAHSWDDTCDFSWYLKLLEDWRLGKSLSRGFVPNSYLVGVVDDKVIGRSSLRYGLNPFLRNVGGHIGYAVLASERQKGYATEILMQSLDLIKSVGVTKVLLTCDEGNAGSQKIIESAGGVYSNTYDDKELKTPKRRYWITLD